MNKADHKKNVAAQLGILLLLTLLVMLVPAPREWGVFGKWVSPYYDATKDILNPTVHVVLMAMIAALIMHGFRFRALRLSILLALSVVIVFAVLFEVLQGLLPGEFGRTCDLADLVPGTIGGILGCVVGVVLRVKPNG